MKDAVTTKAAATAMRRPSIRRKVRSGDIFICRPGQAKRSERDPGPIATGSYWSKDRAGIERRNCVLGLWVPAPVRNCALGGGDTSFYIRFMLTEIFGPR